MAEADGFDADWIVVGSGFGGSVSALRLAEKGYDVAVLEQGRRFADHAGQATRAIETDICQTFPADRYSPQPFPERSHGRSCHETQCRRAGPSA